MNSILKQMVDIYNAKDKNTKTINYVKQAIQECVLWSLSRTDFFEHASFYGGTALRIFYGLDRFSEDLDFSLKKKSETFSFEKYLKNIEKTLSELGINCTILEKEKTKESNILSAFIKSNTKETIMSFDVVDNTIDTKELIKIKLEIDVFPPDGAEFENKYILLPYNSCINVYDDKSLFAGKLHAVICRAWKNRIKGRDLYDYLFYLKRNTKVNLLHLKNRLIDTSFLKTDDQFDEKKLKEILIERFDAINFKDAKNDVLPFVNDIENLNTWNKDLFVSVTKDYDF